MYQFTVEFDRLVALGVRGSLETELKRLRADLVDAQRHKVDAEKRIASLGRKNREALGAVAGLEKRVEALDSDKEALNALVASYQNIEVEFAADKKRMAAEYCSVIAEFGKNKTLLEKELANVRKALSKSHEEAFGALEVGYNLCWNRAVKAGYNMEAHTFALHCEEEARNCDEGGDSAGRAGSAT